MHPVKNELTNNGQLAKKLSVFTEMFRFHI